MYHQICFTQIVLIISVKFSEHNGGYCRATPQSRANWIWLPVLCRNITQTRTGFVLSKRNTDENQFNYLSCQLNLVEDIQVISIDRGMYWN